MELKSNYIITRDYVYYENEINECRLNKGTKVKYHSYFRDEKSLG